MKLKGPKVCAVEPLCQQFGRTGSTNFLYMGTSSNYDALQTKLWNSERRSRSKPICCKLLSSL